MKTKTLIMMCLLLGIGLTQLYAQKPDETKTYSFTFDQGYWSPVFCTNDQGILVLVDQITGTITSKVVVHYNNNDYQWYMLQWSGELTSALTNEVFQIHESNKIDIPNAGVYAYHFNLVGNMGSHYINTGYWDADNSFFLNKSVCPGN